MGESEGTGAAEVVGGGATEIEVAGAEVSPQSQEMPNRPTPVGSKNSKRP